MARLFRTFGVAALLLVVSVAGAVAGGKIGVALSGGGARGFAHIGVLKVLEEVGMPIDAVTGTSMGAVIAGLYAAGCSVAEIEELAVTEDWIEVIAQQKSRRRMNFAQKKWDELYLVSLLLDGYKVRLPSGLRSGQEILDLLTRMTLHVQHISDFRDLPIPFSCVAMDITTGETVVLDSGNLPAAIRASMTFQTVFTPIEIDGRLLADGGLVRNLPAIDARNLGADIVIGVDVAVPTFEREDLGSLVNIISQTVLLEIQHNTREQLELCDVVVTPELGSTSIAAFDATREIIDMGERAARAMLPRLEALADSVRALNPPPSDKARPEVATIGIGSIRIEGLNTVSEDMVRAELKLHPPAEVTPEDLQKGIDRVYHTDAFQVVRWEVDPFEDNAELRLIVTENTEDRFRIGLRFKSGERAALLLNATFRNIARRSSILQFDLKIGNRPAAGATYLTHTGLLSALGVRLSAFWDRPEFDLFEDGVRVAQYKADYYHATLFLGTFYSSVANLGVGIRAERIDLEPEIGGAAFADSTDQLYPVFAVFILDTQDRTIYPTRGLYASVEVAAASSDIGSNTSFTRIFLDWKATIPVRSNLSIMQDLYLGASWEDLPMAYHYFMGGMNVPWTFRGQSNSFLGMHNQERVGPHIQEFMLGIQWEFMRNFFAQARWNVGNTFEEWDFDVINNRYVNGGGVLLGLRVLNARAEISAGTSELNDFLTQFAIGNDF